MSVFHKERVATDLWLVELLCMGTDFGSGLSLRLSGQYMLMFALGLRSSLSYVGALSGTQHGFSVRSVLIWDLAWAAFTVWEWLDPALDVVLLARELRGLWKDHLYGHKEEDSAEQQNSWVKLYLWIVKIVEIAFKSSVLLSGMKIGA